MGLRYDVLDILPVTLAGLVCTIAVLLWMALLLCRYISHTHKTRRIKQSMSMGGASTAACDEVDMDGKATDHLQLQDLADDVKNGIHKLGDSMQKIEKEVEHLVIDGAIEIYTVFKIERNMHRFLRHVFPSLEKYKDDDRKNSTKNGN